MAGMQQPASKRLAAAFHAYPDLLPDLPDELVLNNVIPRLPWHDRPVCRAVSKSWKASIDASTKSPHLLLQSRHHLLPLLQDSFVVCTYDNHVFISKNLRAPHAGRRTGYFRVPLLDKTYQICKLWRKLPSLRKHLPPSALYVTLLTSCGTLYAWSYQTLEGLVLKMDMAGGEWTWKKISVPYPFRAGAVPYKAKIYVPRIGTQGESAGTESNDVLVYDMMNEQCRLNKTWNRDNLRAFSTTMSGGNQELYSFVDHQSSSEPELEVLVFDDSEDSWRTKARIPIPDWMDTDEIELVNADCFQPAPEGGINIVFADFNTEVLSWFNSSMRQGWVEFGFDGYLKGKNLEHLRFIHGQLYGIFYENRHCQADAPEEDEEVDREEQQDPLLYKRTIMKGTMVVGTESAHWEEILDVGCFSEAPHLMPIVVSPIEHYTLMA